MDYQTTTSTRYYAAPPGVIWPMTAPGRLASAIRELRLSGWKQHGPFEEGTEVEEVHVIGGIPAAYTGKLIKVRPNRLWAMETSARWSFPWSLPHSVSYSFRPVGRTGCELRITCRYSCRGLLVLPFFRRMIAREMKAALAAIHTHIATRLLTTRNPKP